MRNRVRRKILFDRALTFTRAAGVEETLTSVNGN